jgi:hypothetical protein
MQNITLTWAAPMSSQTTTPGFKPAPATGSYAWLCKATLVEDLLSPQGAPLRITGLTQRGPVTKTYHVRYLGRKVGFELRPDAGETLYIDTSFGPDARSWTCSCADCIWRDRQCKHTNAVHAATAGLGV